MRRKRIDGFLKRFHENADVDTTFTNGCCYWFSFILAERFFWCARIMYDQVANHFGTEIDGRVYDVTGDVTEKYDWEPWNDLEDTKLKERIKRDCIMF